EIRIKEYSYGFQGLGEDANTTYCRNKGQRQWHSRKIGCNTAEGYDSGSHRTWQATNRNCPGQQYSEQPTGYRRNKTNLYFVPIRGTVNLLVPNESHIIKNKSVTVISDRTDSD